MAEFLVIARDFPAPEGPSRRLEHQPAHRQGLKSLQEHGNLLLAGPLTDDAGVTIGSMMVIAFETRKELDAWAQSEPYVAGRVWETVEVTRMRVTIPAPNS